MADKEHDKKEEEVYDEDGREDLVDDDELSPEEVGFMKGYEDADESEKKKKEEEEEEEKEE